LPEHAFYADADGSIPIAHRGGDAAGAENQNSVVAFDSARQAGIRYGETDTVATIDGFPLGFHGSYTEKHAARTGLPLRSLVETMTLEEVRREFKTGGKTGAEIPTLEELLVTFPDMRFFVDPKEDATVAPLANLINKLKVHDRISVGAMQYRRTQGVAELVGGFGRIATSGGNYRDVVAALGGRARVPGAVRLLRGSNATQLALPHKASHLKVPASDEGPLSHIRLVTPKMVERAHEQGMRVVLWTPNTEAAIEEAFATGADGVMSDRTELVKRTADSLKLQAV
jgi:glycerophosphoryl diester phosphodiesterase